MGERRRRPGVAGLLSLLTLGLGDAYNGFPGRGARLLFTALGIELALAGAWSVLSAAAPVPGLALLLLAYFATPFVLQPYGAVRSWRDARRLRDTPAPARRLRACVGYLVGAQLAGMLVAIVIRTFAVQAFRTPSGAMLPTLAIGDHFFVNKLVYGPRLEVPFTQECFGRLPGFRHPRAGDIVTFIWPKDRTKDFVKRVVAVEGQTIEVRQNRVYVDGEAWDDPHAISTTSRYPTNDYGPTTVPPGHVFVMGDNRDQSYDSRFWGTVPVADIKGQARVIYWSWDGQGGVRWERVGRGLD